MNMEKVEFSPKLALYSQCSCKEQSRIEPENSRGIRQIITWEPKDLPKCPIQSKLKFSLTLEVLSFNRFCFLTNAKVNMKIVKVETVNFRLTIVS